MSEVDYMKPYEVLSISKAVMAINSYFDNSNSKRYRNPEIKRSEKIYSLRCSYNITAVKGKALNNSY